MLFNTSINPSCARVWAHVTAVFKSLAERLRGLLENNGTSAPSTDVKHLSSMVHTHSARWHSLLEHVSVPWCMVMCVYILFFWSNTQQVRASKLRRKGSEQEVKRPNCQRSHQMSWNQRSYHQSTSELHALSLFWWFAKSCKGEPVLKPLQMHERHSVLQHMHNAVFKSTIWVNEVSDTRFVTWWRGSDHFCADDGDSEAHLGFFAGIQTDSCSTICHSWLKDAAVERHRQTNK